ncbi:MAG TPA: START domain-containing protein [Puia sp.]|nr:START domain-containing protein [Puia sp.]
MQQQMIPRVLIVVLMAFAGQAAMAQTGWQLKKDKDGIRVFNRDDPHSRFNALRVETTIPARLSSLAALVLDIGNYPQWSFNTQQAYVLRNVGPSELYFYSLIHSPWPATDRDLVVHLRISQDAATRVMTILAESVPDFIPPKKDLVRVPLSTEKWTVTPLPGNEIRVDYQLEIDPGGSVPPVLINSFSTRGPFETFTNLREQIRIAKYRNAVISFLKE